MLKPSRLLYLAILFIAAAFSCTKPVTLGSDFLEDEKSDLRFKDDFPLTFHTEKTDSVLTHSGFDLSQQLSTFLCGHVNDPVFGTYAAEIYAQPIIATVATILKGATLDSVILQLRYDTNGTYSQINTPVTLEVFRMIEKPVFQGKYFSNERFMTDGVPLGSLTFVPHPKDSVKLIQFEDTVVTAPHLRIPLDKTKFDYFTTQDSSFYKNLDTFLTVFNGLYIRMSAANNSMLGFNLLNTLSGLTFYFDNDTIEDLNFKFIFSSGAVNMVHIEHDYTGSMVEPAFGPDPENDYFFLQGLSGPSTWMSIDGLDGLDTNAVINDAELEMYCTFPDGDIPSQFRPCSFIVAQDKTDTSFINSIDVRIALSVAAGDYRSGTYQLLFGGDLGDPDPGPPVVYRYNMKVTNRLKEILKGSKENVIYFNPFLKANVPNRAVFFGPDHPVYAPRLRVYYTAL